MLTTLIPGAISVLLALVFLGVLVWKVPDVALTIVILFGAVPMVVMLIQARRDEDV